MKQFEFYSLKDVLEDFYISEIANELGVDKSVIIYYDNSEITVEGDKLETLLSVKGISLKSIFRKAESRVLEFLKTFTCKKNEEVEEFLHNPDRAIRFQKESISRTYFIIDSSNDIKIVAYFSLAMKSIIIKEHYPISQTKRRRMNMRMVDKENNFEVCSTYLIGQIGRSDQFTREDIDLQGILNYIFGVINKARELVGGRIILVEVDKEPKLIKRYEEHNFENIQSDDKLTQLMQWVNTY
jgi:hypothetical protein